jgi:hypothetical protein
VKTVKSQKADSLPPELKAAFNEAWDDKFPLDIDEAMAYIKKTYGGYHQTEGAYPFDVQVHKMDGKIRLNIVTYKSRKVPAPATAPALAPLKVGDNINPNIYAGIGGSYY